MNDVQGNGGELPRSAYFDNTLRRARSAAEQRSHRYVTFEHLLFALMDDPDALALLQAMGADVAALRVAIGDAVNYRMGVLVAPENAPPAFSYKFDALISSASGDARLVGRREIDGSLALIAIVRDPESNASEMLLRNGFDLRGALQILGSGSAQNNSAPAAVPDAFRRPSHDDFEPRFEDRPAPPSLAPDRRMDAMLADVRNILDMESEPVAVAAPRPAAVAPAPRLAVPKEPAADNAPRARRVSSPLAIRLVERIPRRFKIGSAQTVEVRLTKDEALALFGARKARSGQLEDASLTRAISLRLHAPEGGFTIENLTPETQWIFDRPSFLGEEAFGSWAWSVTPGWLGRLKLSLSLSSRDLDANGLAGDTNLPDQAIDVRVNRKYIRTLGRFAWWLFLLALGAAASQGAIYVLKITGKIPR